MSSGAVGRAKVPRCWRRGAACALVAFLAAALPAAAQDQGLDGLILAARDETASASEVDAEGFQLYRIPFSFHLRSLEKHPWGLRVTFPVSLTSLRVHGVSDVGNFAVNVGIAAITPGLEVEIPVRRWLVRPFGEIGLGKSEDSDLEAFYGAGLRAQTVRDVKKLHITYGGMIWGRKMPVVNGTESYVSFEAGADVQLPLGFSVSGKQARGGVYVIGRAFNGLDLERDGLPPIVLNGQFETGLSFSTEPVMRIWKFPIRWPAVGYQFGRVSGIRVYLTFPF
jgi:hypothetical protein